MELSKSKIVFATRSYIQAEFGSYCRVPFKIQFREQPFCGLPAYPFRFNTALLENLSLRYQ